MKNIQEKVLCLADVSPTMIGAEEKLIPRKVRRSEKGGTCHDQFGREALRVVGRQH